MEKSLKKKLELLSRSPEEVYDVLRGQENWKNDVSLWPPVEFGQIYTYLIDMPGQFTKEKLKCYKSLEAYNYYISGWVQTVLYYDLDPNCLMKAQVRPSQRLTDKPHEAWVGIEKRSGSIITGHCSCMAGLGETCSHVAGILFKIEACLRLEVGKKSCTSLPCTWNQTFSKNVEASPVVDVCFYKANSRKRTEVEAQLEMHHENRKKTSLVLPNQPKLDSQTVYNHLYKRGQQAAFFSVLPGFPSLLFSSVEPEPNLPVTLDSLYQHEHALLSDKSLSKLTAEVFEKLQVTSEESDFLESSTRNQSSSRIWYDHRKGRITASHFYDVLKHKYLGYPTTIVKSIMQYTTVNPNVPALKWGRDHEETARNKYIESFEDKHIDLKVYSAGLTVSTLYPYLGASPDGTVSCDCCGTGVLEIKCPYKYRDDLPTSEKALEDPQYCLKRNNTGQISLQTTHRYYDQIQGQLNICNAAYCDFICWTTKGMFTERIVSDDNYLSEKLPFLKRFFQQYLLPELLTHKLLNSLSTNSSTTLPIQDQESENAKLYCICRKEEEGQMIACDNPSCDIEWFHVKCIGIKRVPKGKWFCLNCKKRRCL